MIQIAYRVLLTVAVLLLLGGYVAAFFRFKQGTYAIGEAVYFTGVLVLMTAVVLIGWLQDRKPRKPE
jgi:hypothetical protein